MHLIIGNIDDVLRVFGPFDNEGLAEDHLVKQGYTAPGGKYFGEGTGRNSTRFEIVEVEAPAALVARM